MKKRLLLILLAFQLTPFVFHYAQAKPVTVQQAQRVAEKVLPGHTFEVADLDGIYLFSSVDGQGFVLVAADDCVRPVLGYSATGRFPQPTADNRLPVHFAAWLDGYRREITSLRAAGAVPSPEVQALWENPLPRKSKSMGNSVDPLLSTRWAQHPYYNTYCPYDSIDSDYCVTGCVATAMAQIMRYWEYPVTGWNSHSYFDYYYGTLSANFDTTHYRWDLMPDTLSPFCDSLEIDAVATLMYHAGVSVNMAYSPRGSYAYTISSGPLAFPCAENALKTYFRYNPMLYGMNRGSFSDAEWDSLLHVELNAARPVLYSGADPNAGGHAFVLDGYDTLGMFHVNWGWGGYYDGFYTIDSLSPGAGSLGGEPFYTFNRYCSALFDVYPAPTPTDTLVTINIVSNNIECGMVEGSGTYHLYDTVTVRPRASEGCRFSHMATARRSIPLRFLACSDMNDTAYFEYIEGDTLGYCFGNQLQSWADDYGTTTEWGIRIPSVMRQARQLTAVELYYLVEGDYTLNIYVGDSIDGATPIYTGVYPLSGESGWRTLELDSMLTFHHAQTLWITVGINDTTHGFPLACADFCGNDDGSWYHLPWGWRSYGDEGVFYSWMLKGVFNSRREYNVVASPNDINLGDVFGMGRYLPGDTITLRAVPKTNCDFIEWSNGSNANPLTFILTGDTAFVASFQSRAGIGEIDDSQLRVAVSGLTVTIDNPTGGEIDLYDISGRLLATHHSSFITHHFSTSGVYLLKMNGLPARKIVVVK